MKIGGKMEVIGIISAHYLPHLGGVERYTYNLAKGLLKEEKIAIYDYSKDILIILKNDNQHYAKDVLRTSASFFFQFWKGFLKNGLAMIRGKLLFGHDKCLEKYAKAILKKEKCFELSGELGEEVVRAMNQVIEYVKE